MARQRWLVAALCAIGLIACEQKKKDAGKSADPAAAKSESKKSDPAVAPPAAAAKDDLSLIPVDAEAVVGVNWAQLQGSALWKRYVQPEMVKDDEFVANMAKVKERCGFDPMTSVTKMSLGFKNLGADVPEGVIVLHGPDRAKTLACADKWDAEAAKEGVTIKRDGDIVLLRDNDGSAGAMFLDDRRLLVVLGQGVTADVVKQTAQGTSTLSSSPAFVDMYGKISKDQSMWFLMNGNSKMFEDASALGIRPKAVFGSLNVSDAISADVRARLDSPEQATQTVASFKGQLTAMASMFDKLDLTNDGADVKLTAAASTEKLQTLIQFAMGGGM